MNSPTSAPTSPGPTHNERSIAIRGRVLAAGDAQVKLRRRTSTHVISQYLKLIADIRHGRPTTIASIRRSDIDALAEFLDRPPEHVIGRIADLVGSTSRQRAAMFAMLSAGTAVILLSPASAAAAAGNNPDGSATAMLVERSDSDSGHEWRSPTIELPGSEAEWSIEAELAIIRALRAQADSPAEAPPVAPQAAPRVAAVEVGTDDEGNSVAVGPPPVPPTTSSGTDDAGNTVAVGTPPVPPTHP